MKKYLFLLPLLLCILSGSMAGGLTAAKAYGGTPKSVYIPDDWKQLSNGIEWDSVNRMKQSANCVVFWGPLSGNDPTLTTNAALRFDPKKILDSMEAVYSFFMDSMKIIPDSGQWAKYKLIIVMNNTWRDGLFTGFAYGGGYDGKAPAMWVDPSVFAVNSWTVTHEFTHAIQNMIPIMYPGHGFTNTNSGFFWETHANFMAFQRYPSFATAADMPRAIDLSSYYIGSGRKHYAQFYFLQQFKDDYGIDFVSRLWRESNATAAETPLETARRLLGLDQASFDDYMMKYAVKSVKWDFSNKGYLQAAEASLDRIWKFRKTVILDSVSEGHFAIPDNQAPQQFGFNIVRLYPRTEDSCNQQYVYLKFKGHTDVNASSGWRYAFVTVDSTGVSSFSDFYKQDLAEVLYKLPVHTAETYFVVMGAPTQLHFQPATIFEPGFPKIYRYPWEIRIQGAIPEGYGSGFRSTDTVGLTGARHANGGGWVAVTASVDAAAYVAPGALVLDRARVTGSARIEGRAELRDDVSVSGNAVVTDFAVVGGNSTVTGNAVVSGSSTVYYSSLSDSVKVSEGAFLEYNTLSGGARIYGNAFSTGSSGISGSIKIGGDAEIGGACSSGTYLQCSGITDGTVTRTDCDGVNNSPLNTDINQAYPAYSVGEMAFGKIVQCGDSVGLPSDVLPVVAVDSLVTVTLPTDFVSLTATASDPDGYIDSVRWDRVSGDAAAYVVSPGSLTTTIRNLKEGWYRFGFRAIDNAGEASEGAVKVVVLPAGSNGTGTTAYTTLKVTPNPTSGMARLTFPIVTGGNIIVYDTKGAKMYTVALSAGQEVADLNLSFLPAGRYYVNVVTHSGDVYRSSISIAR